MKYYLLTICVITINVHYINAQITFDTKNIAGGEYYYAYNEDNLSSKDETGKVDSEGNLVVTGRYQYLLDGKEYTVTYTADKDGYHPKITITSSFLGPVAVSGVNPSLVASLLG